MNGSIDKLSICRNLISVLISAKCQGSRLKTIIDNTDLLLKSLHDNLEAYASGKVSNYFKERNTLKKEMSKDISSIYKNFKYFICFSTRYKLLIKYTNQYHSFFRIL